MEGHDFYPPWVFFLSAVLFALYAATLWNAPLLTRWDIGIGVFILLLACVGRPTTSVDFMHFLFDGHLWSALHLSPYAVLPVDLPPTVYSSPFLHVWWAAKLSPYGPLWQLAMAIINILSTDTLLLGIALLKLLNLVGLLITAKLLWLMTRHRGVVMAFVLNPIVLTHTLHTPHADLWIATAVLYAIHQRHHWSSLVSVVAGVMVKIHGVLFLPFFVRTQLWKKLLGSAIVIVAVVGALQLIAPFSVMEMLQASLWGSSSPSNNASLIYYLLPRSLSASTVFIVSLFCSTVIYGTILVLWYTKRISLLAALIATSTIVPLLLTGLIYPWHWLVTLTLAYCINTTIRPWVVVAVTLGGAVGPLPAPAVIAVVLGMLATYRYLRPRFAHVVQYADYATHSNTQDEPHHHRR